MSNVAHVDLEIYQGEDWVMDVLVQGSDAPTSLTGWQAYMEIRSKRGTLLVRRTTDTGEGITVLAGAEVPTFRVQIPKATTRTLPAGSHVTDMFLVPPSPGNTRVPFEGDVTVSPRRTHEEE